jgi:hypothetical protein
VRYPEARTRLLTDDTGPHELNMEGAGPLEGALDTRQPRGGEDSPGALPDELLGKARDTVELPLLATSTEEAVELLPSELLGVAGAPRPTLSAIETCRAPRGPE